MGLRPAAKSVDLHAGGVFATALEEYYRAIHVLGKSDAESLQLAHYAFQDAWGDFTIPDGKDTAKTRERMWEAIEGGCSNPKARPREENRGYIEQYRPRTDHVQPYFASDGKPTFEYTFAIPLEPACPPAEKFAVDGYFPEHPSGQPFVYCGRFDMLGRLYDRPVVRDEKTTGSSIGTGWADQWNLRAQFMGYVWACQQAGLALDTVVVRGIAIQKTQLVHAEAIKTYPSYMLTRWHEQLRRDLWRIRRAWDEGYFDFNLGEACTSYGGCTFQNVCMSQRPESWMNDFVIHRWNPLEKNPITEKPAMKVA